MTPTSNLSMKVQMILHAQDFFSAKCSKIWVLCLLDVLHNYWVQPHVLLIWCDHLNHVNVLHLQSEIHLHSWIFLLEYKLYINEITVQLLSQPGPFLLKFPRILDMNTSLGTCCDRVATLMSWSPDYRCDYAAGVICLWVLLVSWANSHTSGASLWLNILTRRRKPRTIMGDDTVSTESTSSCTLPFHLFVNFRNVNPLFLCRQV